MSAGVRFRALGCAAELLVDEPTSLPEAERLVRDRLAAVDAACSRFRPDSELVALTDAGPVTVSPLLAEALGVALQAAATTDGIVDPTMGADLVALGYDADLAQVQRRVPTDAPAGAPDVRVRRADQWRDIGFDRSARRVELPAGVRLDLGATAKSWAADTCADLVREHLGTACLVSLGGDVATRGEREWTVGIRETAVDRLGQVVTVGAGGLATSGTQARRWRRGGDVLHHILDPLTGRPAASPWRTVSVWAPTCVEANVLSTAVVAAPLAGAALLRRSGRAARVVERDGRAVLLGGWPTEVAA